MQSKIANKVHSYTLLRLLWKLINLKQDLEVSTKKKILEKKHFEKYLSKHEKHHFLKKQWRKPFVPFMTFHDHSWQFMTVQCGSRQLMKIYDNSWLVITTIDFSKQFMIHNENPWWVIKLDEGSLGFMTIHDSSWQFVKIYNGS